MNSHNLKRLILANSRGSVLVLVGLLLFVFIGVAALAIDIGYLSTSRNELQNAADAAALGASRKLGNIYQIMAENGQDYSTYNVDNADGDKANIIATAKNVAFQNEAARENIIIDETRVPSDIQIGVWNPNTVPKFTETDDRPNAVRVTAHRDADNATGQITTFFTGIFGIDSAPISARATAALTGQSTAEPGELELPVGIDLQWFENHGNDFCGDVVRLYPTGEGSCAGWTSFEKPAPGANADNPDLVKILLPDDFTEHTESPASGVGEEFMFVGGNLSVFDDLLLELERKGHPVDKIYDPNVRDSTHDSYDPNYVLPQDISDNPTLKVPLCEDENEPYIKPCDIDMLAAGTQTQLAYPCGKLGNTYYGDDGCGPGVSESGLRYAQEWETTVVVYEDSDCGNVSQNKKIEGYAVVTLYSVALSPQKTIYARVECNNVSAEDTRGGGASTGVLGSISGLVE